MLAVRLGALLYDFSEMLFGVNLSEKKLVVGKTRVRWMCRAVLRLLGSYLGTISSADLEWIC